MSGNRVLGLVRDTGNQKLDVVLEKLEKYDFGSIINSCVDRYGWDKKVADSVALESKRFFSLTFLDTGYYHIPEADVDEFWHRMILHTRWYKDFCADIFGDFYHHTPEPDPNKMSQNNRDRTNKLMKHWYGYEWKTLVKTCTQCNHPGNDIKVNGLEPVDSAKMK